MRKPTSPENKRIYWNRYYQANKARIAGPRRQRQTEYWISHPEELLWRNARARAKKLGLPFSITIEDIVIPVFCPVLGIRLQRGEKKYGPASPSLDRKTPELGYTRDNILVISWRANEIKGNATAEELQAVAIYAWMIEAKRK